MKIQLTILFALLLLNLQAQHQPPCPKYDKALESGNTFLRSSNYDQALKYFQVAQIAARECGKMSDVPANKIKQVFDSLKAQKKFAFYLKKIAEQQTKEAKAQRATALKEKQKAQKAAEETQAALIKANNLVNLLDFYDGKLALAAKFNRDLGRNEYGFVNKDGLFLIPAQYVAAKPFDTHSGFAQVEAVEYDYPRTAFLIDTTGNEFRLGFKLNDSAGYFDALDLSYNDLDSFPVDVLCLPNLKILLLNDNNIESLPDGFSRLTNLQVLDLSENELTTLPAEIKQFHFLKHLNLTGNDFDSLPAQLWLINSLERLDISSKNIELSKEIGNLKNLKVLWLAAPHITILPDEIGQLKSLTKFNLSANDLKTLPSAITNLNSLTEFNFYSDRLTNLPPEIGNLKSLTRLGLGGIQSLKALPSEIGGILSL